MDANVRKKNMTKLKISMKQYDGQICMWFSWPAAKNLQVFNDQVRVQVQVLNDQVQVFNDQVRVQVQVLKAQVSEIGTRLE